MNKLKKKHMRKLEVPVLTKDDEKKSLTPSFGPSLWLFFKTVTIIDSDT